jgi:AbrB family looped-hinge helix DNA binding protein
MTVLTVTSKGQLTLRKDVLKHLGIKPGDKVAVDLLPDQRVSIRPAKTGHSIEKLFGMLKREGERPLSLEEIDEIIKESWAGRR